MPVFDTPLTTDDKNLRKVLGQDLPVLIVFHENNIDKPLEDTFSKMAKKYAGDLLVARINARENPESFAKYGRPPTPSVVAVTPNGKVKSDAERVRPGDVRDHIKHLVLDKPLPEVKKQDNASTGKRPIHVTDATFRNEVLKSKKPVLVDFWAQWCGPCHQIAPYIEQIAKEYGANIKVAKLDVDANPVMSRRYDVSSIPTMIIFENGQPATRIVGANPVAIRKAVQRFAV